MTRRAGRRLVAAALGAAIRLGAASALIALAACGQRGPLSLPDPDATPPAAEPPADSERDRDDDER